MKNKTLLAMLSLLGACTTDHTIGGIDQDATSDQSLSDGAPPDAAPPPASADSGAPTYADARSSPPTEAGSTVGPLGPVESWTGWIENYQFDSGSDAIKVSFASDSSGNLAGKIILGNGTPPPPPTDPNVGWPPGSTEEAHFAVIEGFSFSMLDGTLRMNRLRFSLSKLEPWAAWCALQIPVDNSGSCLPSWSYSCPPEGPYCSMLSPESSYKNIIVDRGKLGLCHPVMGICECSGSSCTLAPDPGTISFDLFLANGIATGSTETDGGHNVRLTKDP